MARDLRLDALKGALISLVVAGHYLEMSGAGTTVDLLASGWHVEPQRTLLFAIYIVHIPAFVMLAGVTASTRRLGDRIAAMLTLFVVVQLLYVVPRTVLLGLPETWYHPVFGLWFLLAMVWWLAAMPLVERAPRATLAVGVLLAVVTAAAPFSGLWLTWSRAVYFFPFFVLGHLAGRGLLRRLPVTRPLPAQLGLVAFLGTAAVALDRLGAHPAWIRGNATAWDLDAGVVDTMLGRSLALALAAAALVLLLLAVPVRPGLATLGQRSLAIYTLHIGGVVVAEEVFLRVRPSLPVTMLLVALGTAATLWVLSRPVFDSEVRRVSGWGPALLGAVRAGVADRATSSGRR